jgi:NAD(P)-dependent dehydrogenase (short-subunit alcohol dehydrogenase family)
MSTAAWIRRNTRSLDGKTIAVSGATGGLGNALCRHLAALGANLILLDRNSEKSHALMAQLRTEYPDLQAEHIRLNLEDTRMVCAVAEQLENRPIDALILNAGAYHIPRHVCTTGYNNVFQINFVSPYYLARRLLPHLRERGGRVVAVGSIAHRYSKMDAADVDFSTRQASSKVYGNAKRYLMFALYGLCGNGGVAITHPGITFTNITAHYPKLIFALIKHPMKVLFMSPKRASLSILRGLFEDCGDNEWIGPRLLDVWGLPKKSRLHSVSPNEAARIRAVADKAYTEMNTQNTTADA